MSGKIIGGKALSWSVCVGLVCGALLQFLQPKEPLLPTLLIGAALLAGFACGAYWYRNLDEAAREAHKSGWYWGGSGGMVVVGIVATYFAAPGALAPFSPFLAHTPGGYFAWGVIITLSLQIIGYLVFWLGWWARAR